MSCDGSILLNHDGSERRAEASKSLRRFEVIDAIKAEIEEECPGTVSCADIRAAASGDATVLLGGAHTIGWSPCSSAQHRLHNYAGIGRPDESLDYRYANFLAKKECRWAFEYVDRDARTPQTFDSVCFKNLQDHTRLLSTDQSLYSDPRTSSIVDALADGPEFFNHQFAVSMTKLGNILVPTVQDGQFAVSMTKLGNILVPTVQDGGEIRTRCYSVNSNY
ncbi:hypothetical protein Peur_003730 [Populus x canadensis]